MATLTQDGWVVDEIGAGTGSAGRGTFSQMKAISSPANGATFLVTNYGRGGSLWRYSSTLSDWFPTAPVLIYENTAVIDGVAQTAAQILLAIPAEANLLKNKRFRLLHTAAKNGTTDTVTTQLRMGSTGTTADASVLTIIAVAAAQRANGAETWLRMASDTSVERLGGGAVSFGNTGTSAVVALAATVADVTAANFVSISCTSTGATDKPQLGYVALEILP